MSENAFIELTVLEAVMDGDDEKVAELLDTFLPHELRVFERQVEELGDAISDARGRKE